MALAWGTSWGVSWGVSWGISGGALSGSADYRFNDAGVLLPPASPDAGRRTRTIYRVTIDGEVIECRSLNEALALIRAAKERSEAQIKQAEADAAPVPLPVKISTPHRELHPVLAEVKLDLKATYTGALRDSEIRLFIALQEREDEETLLWLM